MKEYCTYGQSVIDIEAREIHALRDRIDATFAKACELILHCDGRVIVIGIGKSGHIARKIAATLASTGTPAFFIHPAEASHGDLGMITPQDIVLAVSNSGETSEILTLLPLIQHLKIPLIAMTGRQHSTLAKTAAIHLDVSVNEEAGPHGLAPTSSTTVTLVMGDALAITLLKIRGFTVEDFARHHPGGSLGKRLQLRIQDIMHTGDALPIVNYRVGLKEALLEMTEKRFGMTAIVDDHHNLLGIYTDGDLRRTLNQGHDIHSTKIQEVMTRDCKTVLPNLFAAYALCMMETHKTTSLMVVNDQQALTGIVHMHDIVQAGIS